MNPAEVLQKHHLKRTSCREGILDVIMRSDKAMSENEIREKLAGNYDRTTFYRSFKTLEESRILHRIVVDHLNVRYAIDPAVNSNPLHAHFYCEACNEVKCMEMIPVAVPVLPKGYTANETEVIIKGVCHHCQDK